MRGIFHHATVERDLEVGVMAFAVRHPGDGIHEGDGLIVILEVVGLADQVAVLPPAFQLLHQAIGFRLRQRRHAALAGFALSAGEVAHLFHDVLLTGLLMPLGHHDIIHDLEKWEPIIKAYGYPLAFVAAAHHIPYIAVVSDLDHHQDPMSSAMDLFKTRDGLPRRIPTNGSLVMFFDIRDLPDIYSLQDGTTTDICPYHLEEEKRDQYFAFSVLELHPELEGTPAQDKMFYRQAKNWKAALEMLVEQV